MAEDTSPIITVVGATATGKSDLALDLADRLGGEIINTDSMQFYRGMDIGTAKLPVDERRGIPHHLIDILDVTEEANVQDFQARARAAITDIRERGLRPILVGGSGLYVRAAVDHMEFPGTDPQVRARLEAEVATDRWALHQKLRDSGREDHRQRPATDRSSPRGHRTHEASLQRPTAGLSGDRTDRSPGVEHGPGHSA